MQKESLKELFAIAEEFCKKNPPSATGDESLDYDDTAVAIVGRITLTFLLILVLYYAYQWHENKLDTTPTPPKDE
jgi:hypothetical protein